MHLSTSIDPVGFRPNKRPHHRTSNCLLHKTSRPLFRTPTLSNPPYVPLRNSPLPFFPFSRFFPLYPSFLLPFFLFSFPPFSLLTGNCTAISAFFFLSRFGIQILSADIIPTRLPINLQSVF